MSAILPIFLILLAQMAFSSTRTTKAIAISLLLLPSVSEACMCTEGPEDLITVYKNAQGIYLTTLSGVSVISNTDGKVKLNIELSVIRRFKGEDIGSIRAIGYSSLPVLQDDGRILQVTTSCTHSYTFGDEYLIVVIANEEVVVSQCSKNVLNLDSQGALVGLIDDAL